MSLSRGFHFFPKIESWNMAFTALHRLRLVIAPVVRGTLACFMSYQPDLSNLAGVTCFFTLLHRPHLFTKLEQEFRNKNSSHDFKLILQMKKNLGDVACLKQAGFLSCDCSFMVWFGAGAKKPSRTLTPPTTHVRLSMFLAIKSTSMLILMILSVILRSWLT